MAQKILITGGAGFIGSNFVAYLQKQKKYKIIVFDKLENHAAANDTDVIYVKGNIISQNDVEDVFKNYGPFTTVFHLASAMPNKEVNDAKMLETNVIGTKNLISAAVKHKTKSFVFTSSNVTYGIPEALPTTEEMIPIPLEVYGKSKILAEEELKKFRGRINIQIIRCPVVSGLGRLGLQAILFDFISDNKKVYVLGDGSNKYQFVDVTDVCTALEKASQVKGFDIYNIGADEILTLKEIYLRVIKHAKSTSKIVCLPSTLALFILSILDKLNLSPLGVYQYSMIGRSLYTDTTKIKKKLHWKPLKTNADTFIENYDWYIKNKGNFTQIGSGDFSANRSVPKMGVLTLLKMIS